MILALVGKAGSGKDTAAAMIPGGRRFSFADPLKEIVASVYGVPREHLWGASELRASVIPGRFLASGEPLTVRHALQTLGMWGRDCSVDTWAEAALTRAREWLESDWTLEEARAHDVAGPTGWNPRRRPLPPRIAVFSDYRFVNEARAIRAAGGEVWRIVRPGSGLTGAAALHPSELEQDSPEMDALVTRVIHNTGTLDDLRAAVSR